RARAFEGDLAEAGDGHERDHRRDCSRRVCHCVHRAVGPALGIRDHVGVWGMTEESINHPANSAEGEAPVKKWYVVTTYSTYENKVKVALQERIRQHHMEEKFGEILIPSETVTSVGKDGKSRVRAKTTFPGYIFVEMEMGEEAWHVVKDTPKVTGFVGNQRPREVKPPHIEDLRKGITEG